MKNKLLILIVAISSLVSTVFADTETKAFFSVLKETTKSSCIDAMPKNEAAAEPYCSCVATESAALLTEDDAKKLIQMTKDGEKGIDEYVMSKVSPGIAKCLEKHITNK